VFICQESVRNPHASLFYLPHESSEHASSGDEIHRERQVERRRGGGAGGGPAIVISCSSSLRLTLLINTHGSGLQDVQSFE